MFGADHAIAFTFRMEDARIGRFLSIDPLAGKYPWNSPYAFSENRVIDRIELEGLEATESPFYSSPGKPMITLITYRLQKGQGPTHVAQDISETYGGEPHKWEDVVIRNPEYVNTIPKSERFNKNSDSYKKNPTPEGTILIIGLNIYGQDGTSEAYPGNDRLINQFKEKSYDDRVRKVRDWEFATKWMLRNINPDDYQFLWNIFISDRGHPMGSINQQDVYLDMEPDLNYDLPSNPNTVSSQTRLRVRTTELPGYKINVTPNNTGDQIRIFKKDSSFLIGDSMIRRVLDTVYLNQTTGETTTEKP